MQPTSFPFNLDTLQQAWQEFMLTGTAVGIDPIILQSWRRCVPRFDPYTTTRPTTLKAPSLTSVLRAQNDLITTAVPFLEDVHQFSEGADSAILLADGTGCTLVVGGDSQAVERLVALGIIQGTYWAEGQMGTNAFGVALLEAIPILVIGGEHYFSVYHHLATAAAPIHDVRGRIIGLMGVVTGANRATPHILSLWMAPAGAICNQLHT